MEKQIRTHRVGSITVGCSLVAMGVLFLVHLFTEFISAAFIFKLWPIILIGIGMELLISNFETRQYVYDKAAILLIFVMTGFAMLMAFAETVIKYLPEGLCL